VPRPETERLVELALEHAGAGTISALDLGTGSGAIALALKRERPDWRIAAVERSAEALAVARANGTRLGLPVEWLLGDWYGPVAGRRFELIVSNPPYVAAGDPHLAALAHEPASALVAGRDGLDALRTIVAGAAAALVPGGRLLVEHGADQGAAVQALFTAAGFDGVETATDGAGLPRVGMGTMRPHG